MRGLAILLMFGVAACNPYDRLFDDAKANTARSQARGLQTALQVMELDIGRYPTVAEGLALLAQERTAIPHFDGPYLQNGVPLDPWGHAYVYKPPASPRALPEVVSYGRDGKPGGEGLDADVSSRDPRSN